MPAAFIDQMLVLAVGEITTASLLIIPRTSSLGLLSTSAFWGGTIAFHMSRGEPYFIQAMLLVLTWVAGFLRNPEVLASFKRSEK